MNTGNSVQEADERGTALSDLEGGLPGVEADAQATGETPAAGTGTTEAGATGATGATGAGTQSEARGVPTRTPPSFQHVRDIQDLIDQLDAVTRQLRAPGHS
jgi:hypothetical protein